MEEACRGECAVQVEADIISVTDLRGGLLACRLRLRRWWLTAVSLPS
jgi:hypothetical protein